MEGRATTGTLRFDGGRIEFDAALRHLSVDGTEVPVGGRAWSLLEALLQRRGHTCTREELVAAVWPGRVVGENNLHVQVNALRRVFGAEAIGNVHGQGYVWLLEPDRPPAERLFGREVLLPQLVSRLAEPATRVLALVGIGGVGKTRLAQAVFERARPQASGGAWAVHLAPLRDAALVPDAIAAAVGLQPQGSQAALVSLKAWLADRQALLLLDNLEHLPGAVEAVLQPLLEAAPGLRLIVTSRVAPAVSDPGAIGAVDVIDVTALASAGDDPPALALLAQRAAESGATLPLDTDAAARTAALSICRRVHGLPLALELVAPRLKLLPLAELEAELARSLVVVGAGEDSPEHRHRSLRDLFHWSVALLSPGARELLPRLAVFAGGFDLAAAEAVAGGPSRATLLDRLGELVDHRLLQRQVNEALGNGRSLRFTLHELVREHAAAECPAALGVMLGDTHAAHLGQLAEWLDAEVKGPRRAAAMHVLAAERANLRVALAWLIRTRRDASLALRLVGQLAWVWYFDGAWLEGRRWQDEALALPPLAAPDEPSEPAQKEFRRQRARALSGAGKLALYLSDPMGAVGLSRQAVELARAEGDDEALAWALFHLAIPTAARDRPMSVALFDEARAIFERRHDRWGEGLAIVYGGIPLAIDPARQGDAQQRLHEGGERLGVLGDGWAATTADHYLGLMALRRGDLDAARHHNAQVQRVARETNDVYRLAGASHHAARIEAASGRPREAMRRLVEAAEQQLAQGGLGQAALLVQQMARVAARLGEAKLAARLLGAASVQRGPALMQAFAPDELAAVQALREQLPQQLGEVAFSKLIEQGQTWTLHEAMVAAAALVEISPS